MARKQRETPANASYSAVIYTRVSSEEQEREGVSLAAQLVNCRRYCATQGWGIEAEFQDVLSGMKDHRPKYQELLERVREMRAGGRQVVVVVAWLHRFGRRVLERVRCREELRALGVPLHSVMEGGEVSDLIANILASVAEEEVRQLSDRVSAAFQHIQGNGWFRGGKSAWGYRMRPATKEERASGSPTAVLDVDGVQAPCVCEAFRRAAAGESIHAIGRWAAALPERERGVRVDIPLDERMKKHRGKSLGYAAVRKLLANPTYIARQQFGDDDVFARPIAKWPALIEDETWAAVQERIGRHKKMPAQASRRFLLSGLVWCPSCQARMAGEGAVLRDGSVLYAGRYRCKGNQLGAAHKGPHCTYSANMKTVDAAVMEEAARVMGALGRTQDKRFMAALRREWAALQAPPPAEAGIELRIRQHEAEAAKASDRIKALTLKLADGVLDDVNYKAMVRDIERTRAAAHAEAARLRGTATVKTQKLPPLEVVLERIGGWHEALGKFDIERQREILSELIERVEPIRLTREARRGLPFSHEAKIQWTSQGEALDAVAGAVGVAA
ncbi:MAG: hypothetical protein AVDCRST_MAG77-1165 [uncultured Chloroflexi bacterium]|uniref:Recombinase family protein n=1 Tax=uncultured Chloroflexota bacterium TaxID=166587 RepID=A0A6J4HQA6_9CHLR|nr:MAG: hypothetical protein AVDCRST_MAG77-1165 [uncultured Chloroflexota bacterium]